jgi:hypothetical protein
MVRTLTRDEALKLHREMWGDMQEDLGDCPSEIQRDVYKEKWCENRFPGEIITHKCFLCEYNLMETIRTKGIVSTCHHCPIDWSGLSYKGIGNKCYSQYKDGNKNSEIYLNAPISEILALPEREE